MAKLEVIKQESMYLFKFTMSDGRVIEKQYSEESHNAMRDYFKPKKDKKKPATAPTLQEVKDYFKQEGYQEDVAIRFHKYYEALDWYDNLGKPVLRWKGKAISSWMKPEAKLKVEVKNTSSFFQQ